MGNDGRLQLEQVEELYRQHGADLVRFLRAVLRDDAAAQDVAQTTFLRLAEQGHQVRQGSIRSWLFQVAYREALRIRRRQALARRYGQQPPWLPPPPEDPADAASRKERAERLRHLLATLPEPQRTVVIERIYQGKTFAEIAAAHGVPLGTVLTRMRLALKKLRQLIGQSDA